MNRIKEAWKKLSGALVRAKRAGFLALLFSTIFLASCIRRAEIEATLWLNNSPIPDELCSRDPELQKYGFYRRLNSGQLEFISLCSPKAREWISIHKDDLERILNRTIPEESEVEEDEDKNAVESSSEILSPGLPRD